VAYGERESIMGVWGLMHTVFLVGLTSIDQCMTHACYVVIFIVLVGLMCLIESIVRFTYFLGWSRVHR